MACRSRTKNSNRNSANWRKDLPIHPAAELLPRMTKEELIELGNDIKASGLISPIVVCGRLVDDAAVHKEFKYSLLDGISRLDAMDAVGIDFEITTGNFNRPTIEIEGDFDRNIPEPITHVSEVDPYAFVLSANLRRRHLTAKQKRELVGKLLKATPEKSNRQIAEAVKVDHKTVASVRAAKEAIGEIPQLTETVAKDGKKWKPRRKALPLDGAIDAVSDQSAEAERKPLIRNAGSMAVDQAAARSPARTQQLEYAPDQAKAPHQIDPDELILQFAEQVRARGLDIARQVGAAHRTMLAERLHKVTDEIALEAERSAKEAHQRGQTPDLPPACAGARRD